MLIAFLLSSIIKNLFSVIKQQSKLHKLSAQGRGANKFYGGGANCEIKGCSLTVSSAWRNNKWPKYRAGQNQTSYNCSTKTNKGTFKIQFEIIIGYLESNLNFLIKYKSVLLKLEMKLSIDRELETY